MNNSKDAVKASNAEDKYKTVEYSFDKTSNLKNGDKITFEISVGKDVPIKEGKKTFTVDGLKEGKTYTLDEIIKKDPISFTGFNGNGSVKTEDNSKYEDVEGDGKLKNEETISIQLTDSYISDLKDKGEFLKGENKKRLKVTGLKEFSSIPNLVDLSKQVDNYAKDSNKNENYEILKKTITYNIERVSSYINQDNSSFYGLSSDNEKKENKVTFKFLSVYKITKNENTEGKEDISTKYLIYGYQNIPYVNETLKLDDLKDSKKYSSFYSYDSEEEATSSIKSDDSGFVKIDLNY